MPKRNYGDLPNKAGVYLIRNRANGFVYIGVSKHIRLRITEHVSELATRKHVNLSLERDWHTFGESNFEFQVVELSDDVNHLRRVEQLTLDAYAERGLLYNGKVTSDYRRTEKFNRKQPKNITLTADQDFYEQSNRAVKRLGFLSLRDFIFSKLKDAIKESERE